VNLAMMETLQGRADTGPGDPRRGATLLRGGNLLELMAFCIETQMDHPSYLIDSDRR
jgi:hypothetical protein